MSTISTHVLDTSLGKPGQGIRVELEYGGAMIGSGVTDADGRVADLVPKSASLEGGDYLLTFFVGDYFASGKRQALYSQIVVSFRMSANSEHYHVPLLLSPFGYSTYRGS